MKWKKILSFLIPFLCLLLPMVSFAKDTDIYMASGEGVEPNILIIFDNSGSMNDVLYTIRYDRTKTYDPLAVPIANRDVVYKYNSLTRTWVLFGTSVATSKISNVPCPTAQNALTNNSFYTGNAYYDSRRGRCISPSEQLRTGNYLNYQAAGGDQSITKLDVAKDTIKDLIDTVSGVKIGLMVFNRAVSDNTAHGGSGDSNSHGGRIQSGIVSLTAANKVTLKTQIDAITASTWTPLAETLYEAGLYFKGGASYFNSGVTYVSPIQYSCQTNYVIIMTDGDPTRDDGYRPGDSEPSTSDPEAHNHIFKTVIKDRDGDGREPGGANRVHYFVEGTDMLGTDYLDDVAKYLYDSDLRSDLTGKQNIITYTIGFAVTPQHNLLGRTASVGGGKYYESSGAGDLATAFQNIVGEVLEQTSSFVAPIVPVSRMESSSSGDKLYLALFQPNKNSMWSGNIKRFGVAQNNSPSNCNDIDIPCTYHIGDILDLSGSPALDGGIISSGATSHWPSPFSEKRVDGNNVEKGGVGDILLNRSTVRNIYTYLGTSSNLADSSNAFTLANTSITPSLLGLLSSDNTGRDNLIKFVHGYDAYDEDGDTNFTEKRNWILGAFLHSRPLIVHYASQSVIFAGANDGMLHAFNDETGEELWGFIPPNLLNKLQALRTDVNASFVDGSPKAYIERNTYGSITKVILMFGQRRGGNRYYALDVTNPSSPQYIWEINPDASGSLYAEIGVTDPTTGRTGQTWSSPNIGKIADGTGEKWVVFIGGGYDDNQDNDPVTVPDSKGRALYVVDVLNGSPVRRFSYSDSGYSAMTYSIPSDIARVDTDGDGKINRLYVGDMGGRMWRFDISDPTPANWSGGIIFESNPGNDGTTGRKIFYPPDVTLERGNYEMLFFGTGDRENPKEETVINRLYDIKDKSDGRTLTESNLYDVTSDELQESGTTAQRKSDILAALNLADGWLIKLYPGEKSLSAPVLFYKTAYFTTFSPIAAADPCDARFGTARMYALDYTTGNAVFNLDLTNDSGGINVERSDRSKVIGTAIPSGVIITFLQGTGVAYTGVGGGVYMPPLPNIKSLVPIYWRIVF